jgi:diaminopimelate decarboxylase
VSARPLSPSAVPGESFGGVSPERAFAALRVHDPTAHACWYYDLDELEARARRFVTAFASLDPLVAYALKANALPAMLTRLRACGVGAEAGSLGELEAAAAAGFDASRRVLNGNGRTPEEAAWAAGQGVALVNADHVAELDLLEAAVARVAGPPLRVALRVNPGIETPGHHYVSTGGGGAKFGVAPADALAAWAARSRWPHLRLDGVHMHVGSQLLDAAPLEQALDTSLALADESARRGAPLGLVNLGSGFGIDYSGAGAEFPLERHAASVCERVQGRALDWVLEPGRWLVAPVGMLLAEVLWVKERDGRRFVVLAAGMNDLLRPALYGARHRIEPVVPRAGEISPATVVGPVCESADVFATGVPLPPLAPGDLVAIRDAGAYGAAMASNYNGRGRLAELTASGGRLMLARAAEAPVDVARRGQDDTVELTAARENS